MIDVVIASYKEDLSFVDSLEANAIVYDKGGRGVGIPLENIGREAHTYVHHIVKNYKTLPEWTAFIQGNPFDHAPHVLTLINDFEKISSHNKNEKFYFIGNRITKSDINGLPDHPNLDIAGFQIALFGGIVQFDMMFIAGAQFIVHRDLIKNKKLSFWKRMLKIFEEQSHADDAWCAERLWTYIFNYHK
jgi:hypothetical protein